MDNTIESVEIVRIDNNEYIKQQDVVIKETPLTIFVNNQELVTLLCSPTHQKSLVVGFLFSEGIISQKDEIETVMLNENKGIVWVKLNRNFEIDDNFRKGRTITSGCAQGLTFHKIFAEWDGKYINSKLIVSANIILEIVAKLKDNSPLFQKTGGAHSSTLYHQSNHLFSREDIGRHNTVDKIIGECLVNDICGEDKVLITSGRISSEVLIKTARWRIPILISRSAPTSSAVKLADEFGITLIGFARGKRINIYTNSWRIKTKI